MFISSGPRMLNRAKPLLHPYMLFLVVCLAVWIPDGFNIGPVNDGWIKLGQDHDSFLTAWIGFEGTDLFNLWHYLRLLVLATGGFQVCQLALLVLSVLRAVLWYEVVKRILPRHEAYAVASGLVALFHPFDGSYFWLGALGVHLPMLWALALCVVALEHLRTGSRASLLGLYVLQFMTCFTYTGYLPLAVGVPAGAWLLRRLENPGLPLVYLLKISVPIVLFMLFQLWIASMGVGREGEVLDPAPARAWAGYVHAGASLLPDLSAMFTLSTPLFLMMSIVPALLACALTYRESLAADAAPRPVFLVVFAGGLLLLALASFLPYAVSTDRFGANRQLLAAGIFISMIFLLLPFVILPRYVPSQRLSALLLAALTVATVVTGFEARAYWVKAYRAQETLLAAVSTAVPNPPASSLIAVQIASKGQAEQIRGFYNRAATFRNALQLLYGDDTLDAAFIHADVARMQFDPDGMSIAGSGRDNTAKVAYGQWITLDYARDYKARVNTTFVLQSAAQQHVQLPGKVFAETGTKPGASSKVCSMLERPWRPSYCH